MVEIAKIGQLGSSHHTTSRLYRPVDTRGHQIPKLAAPVRALAADSRWTGSKHELDVGFIDSRATRALILPFRCWAIVLHERQGQARTTLGLKSGRNNTRNNTRRKWSWSWSGSGSGSGRGRWALDMIGSRRDILDCTVEIVRVIHRHPPARFLPITQVYCAVEAVRGRLRGRLRDPSHPSLSAVISNLGTFKGGSGGRGSACKSFDDSVPTTPCVARMRRLERAGRTEADRTGTGAL